MSHVVFHARKKEGDKSICVTFFDADQKAQTWTNDHGGPVRPTALRTCAHPPWAQSLSQADHIALRSLQRALLLTPEQAIESSRDVFTSK